MKCRICGSNTTEYLNLGEQPPSDAFLTAEQLGQEEAVYPLIVEYCPNCSLSQLNYVVPPEILYNDEYPYETRMNTEGIRHFRGMARSLTDRFKPDYVVDIGSNDGTLLEGFECNVFGIEPVMEIALKASVPTINDFLSAYSVDQALICGGKADIITACNVFAHVDNLHGFMRLVDRMLKEDGVFVIEAPYLPDMIDDLAFDTIYHEHLSYLSIKPLVNLFLQYDMEIFDVEHFDVHCGTMRYYVARKGVYEFSSAVDRYFENEIEYHDIGKLKYFAYCVLDFSFIFTNELDSLKKEGKTIVGVSSPAKGNTLLNYCKIDTTILDYITEKSDRKIGKFTPGTRIPIVSDSRLIEDQPDYALILAHNWTSQIKNSLKDYKGEWINYAERFKDLCSGTQRTCGECDCTGTKTERVHECCGVQS